MAKNQGARAPKEKQVEVVMMDINDIYPNPDNEKVFNMDRIEQMERAIIDNGFIEPVVVFPMPRKKGCMLVSGERRWRAAKNGFLLCHQK